MHRIMGILVVAVSVFSASASANANANAGVSLGAEPGPVADTELARQLQSLANSKQWKHLLHIRRHPFSGRVISQNDDPEYFLANDGKYNRLAELQADYAAFKQTDMADNQSAQCEFPARYVWLKSKLPKGHFTDQPCSELDDWLAELQAHSLTLIFPASHINSPSSMYGHTLVRMDRKDPNKSKLLAYSVNFAANADPRDNELVFSYKGLAGGYPGVLSVLPYYVKTNEYQHMEYRDVWEYPLNFTPEEVQQFARHVWETKDHEFDYFFFDENCSYRLLALFDAASERSDVTDDFLLKAIPVDTIRSLQQRGLIKGAVYRPSAATALEYKALQASDAVNQTAKQLVESDTAIAQLLEPLTPREQARALELAHAYARYQAIKGKQSSPALRQRTLAILSARSKVNANSEFIDVPPPAIRDDEGHLTQRMQFKAGRSAAENFAEVGFRVAYHEVLDLPKGFVPGSQIQMGTLDLRYWSDQEKVKVQQFKLIDVLSLSHKTLFQNPTAWGVSFGLERFSAPRAEMYGYLKVAFGKSYLSSLGRFYALAETQLLVDNQFDEGFQLSLGPRAGWLIQHEQWQHNLEVNWQPLVTHDNAIRRDLSWTLGWRLADDKQLRAGFKRQLQYRNQHTQANNETELSFVWYF